MKIEMGPDHTCGNNWNESDDTEMVSLFRRMVVEVEDETSSEEENLMEIPELNSTFESISGSDGSVSITTGSDWNVGRICGSERGDTAISGSDGYLNPISGSEWGDTAISGSDGYLNPISGSEWGDSAISGSDGYLNPISGSEWGDTAISGSDGYLNPISGSEWDMNRISGSEEDMGTIYGSDGRESPIYGSDGHVSTISGSDGSVGTIPRCDGDVTPISRSDGDVSPISGSAGRESMMSDSGKVELGGCARIAVREGEIKLAYLIRPWHMNIRFSDVRQAIFNFSKVNFNMAEELSSPRWTPDNVFSENLDVKLPIMDKGVIQLPPTAMERFTAGTKVGRQNSWKVMSYEPASSYDGGSITEKMYSSLDKPKDVLRPLKEVGRKSKRKYMTFDSFMTRKRHFLKMIMKGCSSKIGQSVCTSKVSSYLAVKISKRPKFRSTFCFLRTTLTKESFESCEDYYLRINQDLESMGMDKQIENAIPVLVLGDTFSSSINTKVDHPFNRTSLLWNIGVCLYDDYHMRRSFEHKELHRLSEIREDAEYADPDPLPEQICYNEYVRRMQLEPFPSVEQQQHANLLYYFIRKMKGAGKFRDDDPRAFEEYGEDDHSDFGEYVPCSSTLRGGRGNKNKNGSRDHSNQNKI